MKPETRFYQEVKKNIKDINWTRLENLSGFGTPDLLAYNKNHFFFTVELKVAVSNKIRFSPHQIAFHIRHPLNSFILVKSMIHGQVKLYEGQQIEALVEDGLKLDPLSEGLEACGSFFQELGAWSGKLDA